MEKDYSLLRPFDLEAANNKAPICWPCQGVEIMFVGMASDNKAVIEYFAERQVQKVWPTDLRMAPLDWVKGRPVYNGDVLWHRTGEARVTEDGILWASGIHQSAEYAFREELTWQKPKTKREGWVNIYPNTNAFHYETKEDADRLSASDRIACCRIEWEE